MTHSDLGRRLFGAAAFAFGVTTLAWHDYNGAPLPLYMAYAAGAAEVFGGAAILFRRTAKIGAAVLVAVFLVFALRCVPQIIAKPQIYNSWGNFFEQFSMVTGAAMVFGRFSPSWPHKMVQRIGGIVLGACTASFALEQAFYLRPTATLVPKWLPPNQMFWAIATTVLFALAAVALLANRWTLLATRLLTLMLVMFGLLVWIRVLLADSHTHAYWSETIETFAIAGAAWILADLLSECRTGAQPAQ